MPLLRAFRRFLDLDSHDPRAVALYGTVVEQARKPVFYTGLKVADTVDGRFDMIVLHLFLILNRFPREERQSPVLRALLEEHFADMDNSLREIGVGDLSVPKKIHRMIDALYGRFETYEKALGGATPVEDIADALTRNVYRGNEAEGPGFAAALEGLTRYVLEARTALAAQDPAAILGGTVSFPEPRSGTGNEA
ncbi:ubiquinol-cytochrome C chaperone family protein [Hwanghaeella sp.]|uniref:ubiquinol-cytochrome C chaperone family protein n=1 Tax=Hwanghaeella sp. TaxID=2605943 RepID=UPI003CCC24FE